VNARESWSKAPVQVDDKRPFGKVADLSAAVGSLDHSFRARVSGAESN